MRKAEGSAQGKRTFALHMSMVRDEESCSLEHLKAIRLGEAALSTAWAWLTKPCWLEKGEA